MPTCLICNGSFEPAEFPFGAAPAEPCACGNMASKRTVQAMGVDWFVRQANEWRERQTWTAEDEANDRADHAIDERGDER